VFVAFAVGFAWLAYTEIVPQSEFDTRAGLTAQSAVLAAFAVLFLVGAIRLVLRRRLAWAYGAGLVLVLAAVLVVVSVVLLTAGNASDQFAGAAYLVALVPPILAALAGLWLSRPGTWSRDGGGGDSSAGPDV
jgi:hypothetical protein